MIPTPWSVSVKRYTPGATDDFGNSVDAWAASVSLPVHFVAPALRSVQAEPFLPNRGLLSTDKMVGAPKHPNLPGARDVVTWADVDYQVEGEIDDYTFGPWANPAAGVTFLLRRIEG